MCVCARDRPPPRDHIPPLCLHFDEGGRARGREGAMSELTDFQGVAIALGIALFFLALIWGCLYWFSQDCKCPDFVSRGSRRGSTPLPSELPAPPARGYPPQWYAPGYPSPYPPQMYR